MSTKTKEKRKSGVFLGPARVPQLIGPRDGDKGATYYEIHHKNVMSRFGKENENPMNKILADDTKIMDLVNNSNWDYLSTRWYRSFFCNACSCPVVGWLCFCGLPYCQGKAKDRHREFADAHKLTLREKSLLWEVKPYHYRTINYENDLSGHDSGISPDPFGWCTDLFMEMALKTELIYEVIPLQDIHSMELLHSDINNYGDPIVPPTLVVRLDCNPDKPAFAIDSPVNGEEFIKTAMAQVAKAKANKIDLPDDWVDYRDAYFDSEVDNPLK